MLAVEMRTPPTLLQLPASPGPDTRRRIPPAERERPESTSWSRASRAAPPGGRSATTSLRDWLRRARLDGEQHAAGRPRGQGLLRRGSEHRRMQRLGRRVRRPPPDEPGDLASGRLHRPHGDLRALGCDGGRLRRRAAQDQRERRRPFTLVPQANFIYNAHNVDPGHGGARATPTRRPASGPGPERTAARSTAPGAGRSSASPASQPAGRRSSFGGTWAPTAAAARPSAGTSTT